MDNQFAQPTNITPTERRFPWRIVAIVGVVLVLIIVAAVVLFKRNSGGDSQDPATLYVEREGYSKDNAAVGDPTALKSKMTNRLVQYQGVDVLQPCTLIGIEDVRQSGLKILATPLPGAVTRVYFDGQGTAPLPRADSLFVPFDDDTNNCSYGLEDKGIVQVTAFQPAYANSKAMDREVAQDFKALAPLNGMQVYEKNASPDDDEAEVRATYVLRSPQFDVQLYLKGPDGTARQKLLTLLAQRLEATSKTPTPLSAFTYESPIFEGKVPKTCDILHGNDFKTVFSIDAGPFVEESLAGSVGVIRSSTSDRQYNYIAQECKRRSGDGSTDDKTLRMKITTYESENGAKDDIGFDQGPASMTKNLQTVAGVGDEAYFADTAGMQNALTFRKGKLVVQLSYFVPDTDDGISDDERIKVLTPLAKSIANERLAGF